MTDKEKEARIRQALDNHKKGYNCAQAVSCAFCDLTGTEEKAMFTATEGLGLGMGCMEGTCGAISAAAVLSGLKNSTAQLEKPNSKAISYKDSKACIKAFRDLHGTVICKELKGIETGKVIRSCDGCIEDAARIIAEHLFCTEQTKPIS